MSNKSAFVVSKRFLLTEFNKTLPSLSYLIMHGETICLKKCPQKVKHSD